MNTRNRYRRLRPPADDRGFTLIEVLIALLILAIGVSGVAVMQMATYKQLQTSHNYGTAAMLAGELAERMEANSVQALANAYNHTSVTSDPKDCAVYTCTPAEIAAHDIAVWQARVTGYSAEPMVPGSLPAGRGAVARVAGTNDFTITIRWDDDLSGSDDDDCTALDPDAVQDEDDLDCYVLTMGF